MKDGSETMSEVPAFARSSRRLATFDRSLDGRWFYEVAPS